MLEVYVTSPDSYDDSSQNPGGKGGRGWGRDTP